MKEVLALSDAARELDVRKGVGENGSDFPTIKSMLNQTTWVLPEGEDAALTEKYHKDIADFHDELMIAMITLKWSLLSKYDQLKADL